MMVRWVKALQGTDVAEKYCGSTLRLLNSVISSQGDLMENKHIM